MQISKAPANEQLRIQALKEYSILDTMPEEEYDDITFIASQICQMPISLISLVDETRQWFKSKHGLDAPETSRDLAFCAHAIHEPNQPMIVNDSRTDERFFDNPLVTGGPRVIFYTGVPLVNPDGYPLGTLCVIDNKPNDLDDDQLKALKSLANQVVKLLELRKNKKQLEAANNDLRAKNEALDQFARIAAHDIKAPLGQMILLTDFITTKHAEKLHGDLHELFNLIRDSSSKLKTLVEGILAFSKNNKILKEQKEMIRIDDLISETIVLVDHKKEFNYKYPNSNKEVYSNKIALRQIFLNLLSNGIKYNDKTDVSISVDFYEDEAYYHFSVKDNGKGIAKEYHDKIFETFQVLEKNDRFGNPGNGLGLSTVKKLIEGLGGTINVLSTPGEGANFMFSLRK